MFGVILLQSHIALVDGECVSVAKSAEPGINMVFVARVRIVTWTTLNMAPLRLHPRHEEVFLSNKFLIRKTHVANTMP